MFMHNKRLMYTVRVSQPDPKLASLILEQFGGPQGELAAAMRYFMQGLCEEDEGRKDLLMDIATEEISHLEVVGSIIAMLNRGVKAKLAEGMETVALLEEITKGGESHTTTLLHGGLGLVNSAGVPWTAAYVDTIGDPAADLRSNIAAESRAKIVYERLINITDDVGIKDALGFLMTREIAHQKSFEKALYSIPGNFPPGKIPGKPEFTDVYYNLSSSGNGGDTRGPWNQGKDWDYVNDTKKMAPVDGGDGKAKVELGTDDRKFLEAFQRRTKSIVDEKVPQSARANAKGDHTAAASNETMKSSSHKNGNSRMIRI